jgi:hypothetical protein
MATHPRAPKILSLAWLHSLLLLLGLPGSTAWAVPITSLLGSAQIPPTAWKSQLYYRATIDSSDISDVEWWDGTLYISGRERVDERAAVLSIPMSESLLDLSAATVQILPSVAGSEPGPQRVVSDIAVVNGEVIFGGSAQEPLGYFGTTWNAAGEATSHNFPHQGASHITRISPNGFIAGFHANHSDGRPRPAVGTLTDSMQQLPTRLPYWDVGSVRDMTPDGRILVGSIGSGNEIGAVWRSNDPQSLDYELDSFIAWTPDGSVAFEFTHVISHPQIGEVVFGHYTDLELFTDAIGAWDLTTGEFLGRKGYGNLIDVMLFGDTVILGIKGFGGGGMWYDHITTFEHPDDTIDLISLFPQELFPESWWPNHESLQLPRGGLYEGPDGTLGVVTVLGSGNTYLATATYHLNTVWQPGDFDNDGVITGRDFLAWQRNPDIGDLAAWQAHYGMAGLNGLNGGGTPPANVVPEPGALVMMVLGLSLAKARRRGNDGWTGR